MQLSRAAASPGPGLSWAVSCGRSMLTAMSAAFATWHASIRPAMPAGAASGIRNAFIIHLLDRCDAVGFDEIAHVAGRVPARGELLLAFAVVADRQAGELIAAADGRLEGRGPLPEAV